MKLLHQLWSHWPWRRHGTLARVLHPTEPRYNGRLTGILTTLLRVALLGAGIYAAMSQNWAALFSSIIALILTLLPQTLAGQLNVRLPLQFEFAIVAFIYATLFLGEVHNYYERFWWWDAALHTGSAFAFGFTGFLILFLLQAKDRLRANPWVIAVFSFGFGVAIGAIWEIFEFTVDQVFGTNMQKSGLRDTMGDLIVDTIGAGTASAVGFIYLKYKIRDPFDVLVKWFVAANPRFKPRRRKAGGIDAKL